MKRKAVCRQELFEPTLLQVLQAALPFQRFHRQNQPQFLPYLEVLSWRLPIASLFSSGQYFVSFPPQNTAQTFTFKDVQLIEESFASFNVLCRAITNYLPIFKGWCMCSASSAVAAEELRALGLHASSNFCWMPSPCSASDYKNRLCRIEVDPFRKSCVLIDGVDSLDENSVRYNMSAASLLDTLGDVDLSKSFSDEISKVVVNPLIRLLGAIPSHALCLLLGIWITVQAKELAERPDVQTVIQALLGLSLAALLLMFLLYRPLERIFSRYGGVVGMIFPYSLAMTVASSVYRHPRMALQILWLFADFW
jgi:hypothetical protein